jgi:hypothetical protein
MKLVVELDLKPGTGSTEAHLTISLPGGAVLLDKYRRELSPEVQDLVGTLFASAAKQIGDRWQLSRGKTP